MAVRAERGQPFRQLWHARASKGRIEAREFHVGHRVLAFDPGRASSHLIWAQVAWKWNWLTTAFASYHIYNRPIGGIWVRAPLEIGEMQPWREYEVVWSTCTKGRSLLSSQTGKLGSSVGLDAVMACGNHDKHSIRQKQISSKSRTDVKLAKSVNIKS